MTARSKRFAAFAAFALSVAAPGLSAHDEDGATKEKLGKVRFANCCSPKVQAELQRAVAMLHSFWYSAAEKAFEDVARQDPTCAIAAWGFASILMSNPLAGSGASAKDAPRAQAAIDKGRAMGAKTQRERDYLEAVAAYYDEFRRPQRARAPARPRRGLRSAGGEVSEGRRGADLLRALPRRHAAAVRPDLRRLPQGGGDPREAVQRSIRSTRAWRTT